MADLNAIIGLAITGGTLLLGVGGAWRGVIVGLRSLKEQNSESTKRLEDHLRDLTTEVDSIRREFLTKELHAAQEKTLLTRIEALERQHEQQKRRRGTT